ncbi:TetR/AcrR family transcriptional regulator [Mucilaginibacter roseus]|uniref:TetR/AcrR family transcriptional regulator n=1 Tax=Mucilaginibacter roseus TaxID=1528868 RepID=A0ABS8U4N3_9SPHI|nr:helix-turn-helix domain-containing protein [Mucilaginibacter roseus]MCD8740834.1 TetR/AcrR family transcriptional regulator [Mucilaginibacter roseus]
MIKAEAIDKVREDIITAAEEVFQKYGYLRVSMQDISKASGKGRSTLYYYFRNKMEVFDAVSHRLFGQLLKECQKVISPDATFVVNIERYYSVKLRNLKKIVSSYELVTEDFRQDPSLLAAKTHKLQDNEIAILNNIIQWAQANNEIAQLSTEDSTFLAEIFVTAFKSYEQEIVLYNKLQNFEEKINWLAQILHKGLT